MHKNREPAATYKVDREKGTTRGVCSENRNISQKENSLFQYAALRMLHPGRCDCLNLVPWNPSLTSVVSGAVGLLQ